MIKNIINKIYNSKKEIHRVDNLEINNKFKDYVTFFEKEDDDTTWEYGIFSKLISEFIPKRDNLNIIEIGIARGGNVNDTFEKLGNRITSYIGVDPYTSGYDESDIFSQKSQIELDYCYSYVLNKINDDRFKLYRSSSEVVAPLIPNNSIDAIYIDGDHTYEGVLRDITLWRDKIKRDGITILL